MEPGHKGAFEVSMFGSGGRVLKSSFSQFTKKSFSLTSWDISIRADDLGYICQTLRHLSLSLQPQAQYKR